MSSLSDDLPGRGRHLRWLAGFAVWTVLGVLALLQAAVGIRRVGETVPWGGLAVEMLSSWYICALFTPLYFALVRRFPLERGRWPAHLAMHLAVVAASPLVKLPLYVALLDAAGLLRHGVTVRGALARNYIPELMSFGVMLAVVHGVEMHWRARDRERQAARLREQLAGARLEALTAALQPHFLFNSLQAVSTLMHRDVAAADAMIGGLSDLLRRSIPDGTVEVPVAEEMDFVRCYLSIMQVRFGDRLTAEVRVEPGAEHALVPRLILQPLVENAIRHGIARRPGAGRVAVRATARDGRLRLCVADDGPGVRTNGDGFAREGTGLSNTRLRLREMFGADHAVRVAGAEGGGVEVTLDLPVRRAAEAART